MIWVLNFHSVLSQLTSPCYNTRLKVLSATLCFFRFCALSLAGRVGCLGVPSATASIAAGRCGVSPIPGSYPT